MTAASHLGQSVSGPEEAEAGIALCACGHREREHRRLFDDSYDLPQNLMKMQMCSGNTWAYPDDAESDGEGREVNCQCSSFRPEEGPDA